MRYKTQDFKLQRFIFNFNNYTHKWHCIKLSLSNFGVGLCGLYPYTSKDLIYHFLVSIMTPYIATAYPLVTSLHNSSNLCWKTYSV